MRMVMEWIKKNILASMIIIAVFSFIVVKFFVAFLLTVVLAAVAYAYFERNKEKKFTKKGGKL